MDHTSTAASGSEQPSDASPAKSSGRSIVRTGTAASPATACPTLRRTRSWKPWPMWAAPGGASKPSSKPSRATWGWMSTKPAPRIKHGAGSGPVGATTSPCACWPGLSCSPCNRIGGKRCPRSPDPKSIEWCVSYCPKRGSDPGNCGNGWPTFRNATNGPDAPTKDAALLSVTMLPAFFHNPSL